jgi:hypothetical protein
LISAAGLTANAQSSGGRRGTTTSAPPTAADMARGEMERELLYKELEEVGSPARKKEVKDQQLVFAQMSEDFTRIQVVNNDLVRAASSEQALDFRSVAKSAAEVRKRAQRLKVNMALPETDKPAEIPRLDAGADEALLKSSILTLGKLIAGFAHNPIFKQPNVVDAQLSARARRDLEAILQFSGQLIKVCEKQGKADGKSQ